jgi:multiple antibiotic resistance protein
MLDVMVEFMELLLLAFIPLFVAIDPLGLVPLYLGMTETVGAAERRRIARLATITAAIVAIGFVFLGRFIFLALGITVADFQVAGGLILFVLAASELLFPTKRGQAVPEDFGVVPLGMPLIAGPATLTTLLIVIVSVGTFIALLGLVLNLILTFICFTYSENLVRVFGMRGLRAASKLIHLFLAAIAVSMIRRGIEEMIGI